MTAGWQKWIEGNHPMVGDTVLVILNEPVNGTRIHTLFCLGDTFFIAGRFLEELSAEILYWRNLHDLINDLNEIIAE